MHVHPTAVIHDGAQLGAGVEIGPHCVIGPQVELGDGCRLHSHVSVQGDTHLGPECEVWPFVCLGTNAQDRKLPTAGPTGQLRIGSHNKFREHVTINNGTPGGRGVTTIGDHNMFLIGSHIGHDCEVGSNIVMTNGAMAAGHTVIEDRAVLGAMIGIHQFCRVGRLVMLAAGTMLAKDAPPYAMVHGDRARIRGVNVIGMRRAGMTPEDVAVVKRVYRMLFWRSQVMSSRHDAVRREWGDHPLVKEILDFMDETKRGVLMARGRTDVGEEREPDWHVE